MHVEQLAAADTELELVRARTPQPGQRAQKRPDVSTFRRRTLERATAGGAELEDRQIRPATNRLYTPGPAARCQMSSTRSSR